MEEQTLILLAKRGDTHALSQLFSMHYSFLYKYLLKITMNIQQAEDLTQDTMLKCIQKIHLYNGKSKFTSWLITIATHLHIDQTRKKRREELYQQEIGQDVLRGMRWQMNQQGEEWPEVLGALAEITSEMRIPIILKHYYGYSLEEIAAILEISSGTVKSRIHYGLKAVRKELETNEPQNLQNQS